MIEWEKKKKVIFIKQNEKPFSHQLLSGAPTLSPANSREMLPVLPISPGKKQAVVRVPSNMGECLYEVIPLTTEHKVSNSSEMERLKKAGVEIHEKQTRLHGKEKKKQPNN